ncbi:AAA family ATPase [Virgibacillus sp. CBA3643]|uniref:AAA family ATPase n=1 Tax=Virgibacillus sp. CBA3643 TaxID=2942278 RepID=UPI0035A34C24
MNTLSGPYISKVEISNFRNFKDTIVDLSHKQVVIGENNIGKTNFLRAIQLILDPKLSDEDRNLIETDFFEGLDSPMENGNEIEISINIRGFEHNKMLLSTLSDATVQDEPPTLRLTYKYYAIQSGDGTYTYQYKIFQGYNEDISFTNFHRRYLNLKVIPPIRDVDGNEKQSQITN